MSLITIIEFQHEEIEPVILEGVSRDEAISLAREFEARGSAVLSITDYKFSEKWQDSVEEVEVSKQEVLNQEEKEV